MEELKAFERLGNVLCEKLLALQYAPSDSEFQVAFGNSASLFNVATLQLTKDKTSDALVVRMYADQGAVQRKITPAQLRSRDPRSGTIIEDSPFRRQAVDDSNELSDRMISHHRASSKKSPSLSVTRVEKKGRYGYAVEYADGAIIIYSTRSIAIAAGGEVVINP
jgi:hypothetical protein